MSIRELPATLARRAASAAAVVALDEAELRGASGVSGASEAQDEALARAGLAAPDSEP